MAKNTEKRKRQKENFWLNWVANVGCVCYYCKSEISRLVDQGSDNRATIDHLVPLSRGGGNALSNKVWSCRKCNLKKGDIRLW